MKKGGKIDISFREWIKIQKLFALLMSHMARCVMVPLVTLLRNKLYVNERLILTLRHEDKMRPCCDWLIGPEGTTFSRPHYILSWHLHNAVVVVITDKNIQEKGSYPVSFHRRILSSRSSFFFIVEYTFTYWYRLYAHIGQCSFMVLNGIYSRYQAPTYMFLYNSVRQ